MTAPLWGQRPSWSGHAPGSRARSAARREFPLFALVWVLLALAGFKIVLATPMMVKRLPTRTPMWIRDFDIYASRDGQAWGQPVATGSFDPDEGELKCLRLPSAVEARFIKLAVRRGFPGQTQIAISEFDVITPGPGAEGKP